MKNTPLVSVIIPVYNAEKYIIPAVESIQSQTYNNLEIIIIDDGSKDKSLEIARRFSKLDARIKLIINDHNLGLSKTLNKAVQCANGSYIARMDGDDLSAPSRIEKQLHFLIINPDISVLGTAAISMNEEGKLSKVKPIVYSESNTLSFSAYFTQPLFHGSILAKSEVMKKFPYDESSKAEDFELWLRMIHQGLKIANLEDEMYFYRVNSEGYSRQNEVFQAKSHNDASKKYLESKLNITLSSDEIALINNRPQENLNFETLKKGLIIFNRFITNYEGKNSVELRNYCMRHKVDIYIQAFRKSHSILVKGYCLQKIVFRMFHKESMDYVKQKIVKYF